MIKNGAKFRPRQFEVKNLMNVEYLMKEAHKNRKQAATNLNLHSSRSHCIYQLTIKGKKVDHGSGPSDNSKVIEGTLNMIDLAGSENSKFSGVKGEQLAECNSVNSSLSTLSKVFKAI